MKLTAKQRRELIGKTIEWGEHLDPNRGTYTLRTGVVEDSRGRNLLIDGDWKWYPKMIDVKVIP